MPARELAVPLLLVLFALPAAAADSQVVFAVGAGSAEISFRKEPQGGGLGLSAFTVDLAGNVLALDREGGKILARDAAGRELPPIPLPRRIAFSDLSPALDGSSLWLVANPPRLYRIDRSGKVLEERELAHLGSAGSVLETPTGLLLVHDTTKNVAVVYKGAEIRAALGGFFRANLCLTGDSRLVQPGEETKKGIDLLLQDPYKSRPDEKFARLERGVQGSEILSAGVVGIDREKRVVALTVELHKNMRHLVFHRFAADGKPLGRKAVPEERRCPATLARDFVLGPDGSVHSTGSPDEESRFVVYRHALDDAK